MNRIGINLWNWTPAVSTESLPLVDTVAALGFTAIEFPMTEAVIPDVASFRRAVDRNRLAVSLCAALTAGRDLSHFDPAVRRQTAVYLKTCIDTGYQLGAGVFAGPFYAGGGKCHLLNDEDQKREWDYAVAGIRDLAGYAAESGIRLAIEPIHRYRTSVVNTVRQAIQLVQDVNRTGVSIHFDTYHANIEETSVTGALESVLQADLLGHFHACENNRGAPGTGHLPWNDIFDLLNQYQYQQHVTMETFCREAMDRCWYPLAESQDVLAATGLAFIQSQLLRFEK